MTGRDVLGARVEDHAVPGPQLAKNVVGHAVERLVSRLLGARVWDHDMPPLEVPSSVATETDGTPYGLMPDAWWGRQSALVEVKAGIDRFFATERQWKSYRWARDTAGSGLPVERPRVFYAFVAYRMSKLTHRYAGAHEVIDDALRGLRYVVVADSRLVESYLSDANHRGEQTGPLSPLLGAWAAHWSIRAAKLQAWADEPRAQLDALGLTRWRPTQLRSTCRIVARELADAGWAQPPDIPAVLIAPCRRARPGPPLLPGGQASLPGLVPVECPRCGCTGSAGNCLQCGAFNVF